MSDISVYGDEGGASLRQLPSVDDLLDSIPGDSTFSAKDVLDANPECWEDHSLVVDLAYEDFMRRREAGELIDASVFASDFPDYEQSIVRVCCLYSLCRSEVGKLDGSKTPWPSEQSRFLHYDFGSLLGKGSFSRVYEATESNVGGRRVVVKVCQKSSDEASALGKLKHSHIVPVLSTQKDETTGFAVICMPYMGEITLESVTRMMRSSKGTSLRLDCATALSRSLETTPEATGPLAGIDCALRITSQLASALASAHGEKISHNDIKPSNVLISAETGDAVLLDFNLSTSAGARIASVVGTLAYMAPEELERVFDPPSNSTIEFSERVAADVFSLGSLLYELLSGRSPVLATSSEVTSDVASVERLPEEEAWKKTARKLYEQQCVGIPPLGSINPAVNPALAKLVHSCLSWNPDERPKSAEDLRQALEGQRRCPARLVRRMKANYRNCQGAVLAAAAVSLLVLTWAMSRAPWETRTYLAGWDAFQREEFDQAAAILEELVHLPTQEIAPHLLYARSLLAIGETSAAIRHLRDLRTRFDAPEIPALLGYAILSELVMSNSQDIHATQNAIVLMKVAREAGFESPELLNNLGFAHGRLLKFPENRRLSIDHLCSAIELSPENWRTHLNLAFVYRKLISRDQELGITPEDLLTSIRKACQLAPENARFAVETASILAFLIELLPSQADHLRRECIDYCEIAVRNGVSSARLRAEFEKDAALWNHARFQQLLRQAKGRATRTQRLDRIVDPLIDDDAGIDSEWPVLAQR